MSKPFVDPASLALAGRLRAVACGALLLTLTGCGSSTPRQAEVAVPREVVAAARPSPAEAAEPGRRERRGDRRAADESEIAARAPTSGDESASEGRREQRRDRRAPDDVAAAAGEPVPEAAAAAYQRAIGAMRSENWLEAELELEQLTLEQPAYPGPHVNLALVYLHDGRREDARAALERALELEPGHAAANTQLGIMLREDGEFAEAEAAYRRALATDPEHAIAHYNLGVLLDIYLRRTAEALEHYEQYQASLTEPNETVGRWIIDLRRRVNNSESARVAQGDGP